MNDDETTQKLQIAILTEMFAGVGSEVSEHRIGYYLRLLYRIPPETLRAACDKCVIESDNGFPPGPGQIMQAAEAIRDARAKVERKAWADEQWAQLMERRAGVIE